MSAFESNVSDREIAVAFKNTDFGTTAHRKLLEQAVLKKAVGYHCGHTITCIMMQLCLIGSGGRITKKGAALFAARIQPFDDGGAMNEHDTLKMAVMPSNDAQEIAHRIAAIRRVIEESGYVVILQYFDELVARSAIAASPQQAQAGEAETERCKCCGYLVTASEHRSCLRAALQPQPQAVDEREAFETMLELARRTLWLAYVWNDHNFDAAHIEARRTAHQNGIDSHEQANKWLAAMPYKIDCVTRASLVQPTVAAEPKISFTSEGVSEERIKTLMAQIGMPNSMSLYQAFKQFQNELEQGTFLVYEDGHPAAVQRDEQAEAQSKPNTPTGISVYPSRSGLATSYPDGQERQLTGQSEEGGGK